MSTHILKVVAVLVCLAAWAGLSEAQGQRGQQRGQRAQRAPQPVNLEGTIEGIAQGAIKVATTDGKLWMVHISKRVTQVEVHGTATPAFLGPGVCVKFEADVVVQRRSGTVENKIEKLTIFTPSQREFLGAFPVAGFANGQGQGAADRRGKKAEETEAKASRFDIHGRITGVRNGKLVVAIRNGSVEIELADNPQVEVDVADYRLANIGDKISCQGFQVGENVVEAQKVEITLAEPLGGSQQAQPQTPMPRKSDMEEPSGEPEKASPEDEEVRDKLIALLTPKEDTPASEESFQIEGDPTGYRPSVQGPAPTLQRRFGKPEKRSVKGTLVVDGKPRTSRWQVWTWGSVKVVVDPSSKKARFFAFEPSPTPEPEQEPAAAKSE